MAFKLPRKDDFAHKVYQKLLTVPKGKVTTYKALANAVGTSAYRAIGQVMNKNPYSPDVPCHRVIASDGTLGGYAHGLDAKKRILASEGVRIDGDRVDEKQIIRIL